MTNFIALKFQGWSSLNAQRLLAEHELNNGPFFCLLGDLDDLLNYCEEVASFAPELPFYYYNISLMTGINFSMIDFLKRPLKEFPTLLELNIHMKAVSTLNSVAFTNLSA